MFRIELTDCGKSYNRKWLFKNLDVQFKSGETWAFLGANGSGKSTLALMLSAQVWPTEGKIKWENNGDIIEPTHVFSHISLASPAMELPGEFSLKELVELHGKVKKFNTAAPLDSILSFCEFNSKTADKPLANYSSGMLQRVKLALAAFSETPVLILDEPLTNLDKAGEKLFERMIQTLVKDRILVIASNREDEYKHCSRSLHINPDSSVVLN